jgi:hypothetical protein
VLVSKFLQLVKQKQKQNKTKQKEEKEEKKDSQFKTNGYNGWEKNY